MWYQSITHTSSEPTFNKIVLKNAGCLHSGTVSGIYRWQGQCHLGSMAGWDKLTDVIKIMGYFCYRNGFDPYYFVPLIGDVSHMIFLSWILSVYACSFVMLGFVVVIISSHGGFMWYIYSYHDDVTLCEGNTSATGVFPSQLPVTRGFDVFFDLRLNKRSSKGELRRHRAYYDVTVMF